MTLRHLFCLAFLAFSGPLFAAAAPVAHAQFLPPDDNNLRGEAPEQQQLLQVTEYSVVLGNQRQSNQQGRGQAECALHLSPLVRGRSLSGFAAGGERRRQADR